MKQRSITGRTWLLVATACLLLAAAIGMRVWQVRRAAPAHEAAALRNELATLPPVDPAELATWRGRHAELAARRWTEPARAELESRLGTRWEWRSTPVEIGTRGHVLHAVTPEAMAWPAIIAAVAAVEAAPGVTVEEIAIATAGNRSVRHFSRVEIRVRLQWAESGTAHTVPPESVGWDRVPRRPASPARGAKGRARPAALRRTSASAEPPAPARSPLRSRPDPSRRGPSRRNLS